MSSSVHSAEAFFFSCTACGKCCNSPPAMTVPELFHHQDRFVGCLALRRITRVVAGTVVVGPNGPRPADESDARDVAALAERIFHSLPGGRDYLLLSGQAFGYASLGRCPALDEKGACSVHHDRKPLTCSAVPLDALFPDRLQGSVLSARLKEAAYVGSDCVRTQRLPSDTPFMHGTHLVDSSARALLTEHRNALADEKRVWSARVLRLLAKEPNFAWNALPEAGFFALSIAPVLLVLAEVSEACRARCIAYLDAQARLGERVVGAALSRKSLTERPTTRQLRAFLQTNATLRETLAQAGPVVTNRLLAEVAEIERWLGLPSSPRSLGHDAAALS